MPDFSEEEAGLLMSQRAVGIGKLRIE